jgi:hypothetical protein
MPQNLDFIANPPFILMVTGKPAKIALGNKGFRPQVAGESDRKSNVELIYLELVRLRII